MNKYHEEQFDNVKAYIERIERDNKYLHNEILRLNNIINKAIEYIEHEVEDMSENGCSIRLNKILDILKGSDKE